MDFEVVKIFKNVQDKLNKNIFLFHGLFTEHPTNGKPLFDMPPIAAFCDLFYIFRHTVT
jgi:hypothetical protein